MELETTETWDFYKRLEELVEFGKTLDFYISIGFLGTKGDLGITDEDADDADTLVSGIFLTDIAA